MCLLITNQDGVQLQFKMQFEVELEVELELESNSTLHISLLPIWQELTLRMFAVQI